MSNASNRCFANYIQEFLAPDLDSTLKFVLTSNRRSFRHPEGSGTMCLCRRLGHPVSGAAPLRSSPQCDKMLAPCDTLQRPSGRTKNSPHGCNAMAVCLQPPRFDGERINHSRARCLQCAFCAFYGFVGRTAGHISVTVTQSIGFEEALD